MRMEQLKERPNQDGEDNLNISLLPEDGFKMPPVFDPIVCELHRFFVAVAGTVVNNDGKRGSVPDLVVWSSGTRKPRIDSLCLRHGLAFWPYCSLATHDYVPA